MAPGRVPPLLATAIWRTRRPALSWMKQRIRGSLGWECLNHFIFLSEDHLRRTLAAYIACYNEDRPHQGIEGIPE